MIFVTPSFKQVFTSFGADLPGPTLLVMAVSDLAVDYWYWVLIPVAVLAVVAQRRWARGLRFATLDAALIQIPFVRRYLTKCFVSRLIQVLDRALSGSLPLIPAVAYLRATAGNTRLTGAAGVLEAQLLGGKDLTAAVRDTPSMPGQLATALELGAATQDPGAMLRQLAAFSEGEAARSLMRLQQALIACAYVAAGLIVGFFVIAMYLPIFRMGEAV